MLQWLLSYIDKNLNLYFKTLSFHVSHMFNLMACAYDTLFIEAIPTPRSQRCYAVFSSIGCSIVLLFQSVISLTTGVNIKW